MGVPHTTSRRVKRIHRSAVSGQSWGGPEPLRLTEPRKLSGLGEAQRHQTLHGRRMTASVNESAGIESNFFVN